MSTSPRRLPASRRWIAKPRRRPGATSPGFAGHGRRARLPRNEAAGVKRPRQQATRRANCERRRGHPDHTGRHPCFFRQPIPGRGRQPASHLPPGNQCLAGRNGEPDPGHHPEEHPRRPNGPRDAAQRCQRRGIHQPRGGDSTPGTRYRPPPSRGSKNSWPERPPNCQPGLRVFPKAGRDRLPLYRRRPTVVITAIIIPRLGRPASRELRARPPSRRSRWKGTSRSCPGQPVQSWDGPVRESPFKLFPRLPIESGNVQARGGTFGLPCVLVVASQTFCDTRSGTVLRETTRHECTAYQPQAAARPPLP